MLPLRHYQDLLSAWPQLAEACCITYVKPADLDRLVARMSAGVISLGELSFGEAVELDLQHGGSRQVTLVGVMSDWAVAMEPYGFQGSRAEVLRAVSADGLGVSVWWNVNSRCQLSYARNGRVWIRVDPFDLSLPTSTSEMLSEHLAGWPFGENEQAGVLTVAERITNVRLDSQWLQARHPAVMLSPVRTDLVPEGYHNHPAIADPELSAILDHPHRGTLPQLARLAAELVVRHTGLDTEPLVVEALTTLREGHVARTGLDTELAELADEYARRLTAVRSQRDRALRLLSRWHALRALTAALNPDPSKAAWEVCWRANSAVGGNFGDQLRLAVLTRLVDRASGAR